MKNEESKAYRAVLREDQLDAEDPDSESAINGDYDDIFNDDALEMMMDAEEDALDESQLPDPESELARGIRFECQGTDEKGEPKATVGLTLNMTCPKTGVYRTLAQMSTCKPVIRINNRNMFIEITFQFETSMDSDMRVLWTHLDKFGELQNLVTELSVERPELHIAIVPLSSLGCAFIDAIDPVFWSIQSAVPDGQANELHVLFPCDNVDYYQTDEMDMTDIYGEVQRETEQQNQYYEKVEEKKEAQMIALEERNRKIAEMRKKNS